MRLLTLSLLILTLASCSAPSGSIRTVDPATFASEMQGAFVIQAHTPYEGEISGTDLIAQRWENLASYDLPEDKNDPILIYCRSGRMSGIAAQELASLGYTNIVDLEGGMLAWARSGRSLTSR